MRVGLPQKCRSWSCLPEIRWPRSRAHPCAICRHNKVKVVPRPAPVRPPLVPGRLPCPVGRRPIPAGSWASSPRARDDYGNLCAPGFAARPVTNLGISPSRSKHGRLLLPAPKKFPAPQIAAQKEKDGGTLAGEIPCGVHCLKYRPPHATTFLGHPRWLLMTAGRGGPCGGPQAPPSTRKAYDP